MDNDIDLNLFRSLVLMIEQQSLKAVGNKLGIGESAVSKKLRRLSEQLDYPLFERGENGLEPTPMALELYPKAKQVLSTIDELLLKGEFSPDEYLTPIKVAIATSLIDSYGCHLLTEIKSTFPKAPIEIVAWDKTTERLINQDEISMGVHVFNDKTPASISQKKLMNDQLAIIVGRKQPIPTFDEVITWPFIAIKSTGRSDLRYPFVEQLESLGFPIKLSGNIESTPAALEYSKNAGIACVCVASLLTKEHVRIELPKNIETNINLVAFMKTSHRQNPFSVVLFNCLKTVFKSRRVV